MSIEEIIGKDLKTITLPAANSTQGGGGGNNAQENEDGSPVVPVTISTMTPVGEFCGWY